MFFLVNGLSSLPTFLLCCLGFLGLYDFSFSFLAWFSGEWCVFIAIQIRVHNIYTLSVHNDESIISTTITSYLFINFPLFPNSLYNYCLFILLFVFNFVLPPIGNPRDLTGSRPVLNWSLLSKQLDKLSKTSHPPPAHSQIILSSILMQTRNISKKIKKKKNPIVLN